MVRLLAVSKTHPSQSLREMYQLGQQCFGENYLQEALDKIEELKDLDIEWHFIGHVQRNKTKHLAEKFDWVHGVDRLIIAERLSSQRLDTQPPLNLCIQVNIDVQDSKMAANQRKCLNWSKKLVNCLIFVYAELW